MWTGEIVASNFPLVFLLPVRFHRERLEFCHARLPVVFILVCSSLPIVLLLLAHPPSARNSHCKTVREANGPCICPSRKRGGQARSRSASRRGPTMPAYLQVTYADGAEAEFELKHGSNVIGKVGRPCLNPTPEILFPEPHTRTSRP